MGLFDLFKKREHREKYERALGEKKLRADVLYHEQKRPHDVFDDENMPFTRMPFKTFFLDAAETAFLHAQKKLDKLYEEGHEDAIKLNKQYHNLVYRLGKDAQAVYNFERDKLGIHKRDKIRKSLETTVGIISIISLVLASLISVSQTGNVIGTIGITRESPILLAMGLTFGIIWLFLRR